jgi:hypothetical protein
MKEKVFEDFDSEGLPARFSSDERRGKVLHRTLPDKYRTQVQSYPILSVMNDLGPSKHHQTSRYQFLIRGLITRVISLTRQSNYSNRNTCTSIVSPKSG